MKKKKNIKIKERKKGKKKPRSWRNLRKCEEDSILFSNILTVLIMPPRIVDAL